MPTVIVHGPVACGKTHHAARIAAKIGIPADQIVDDWLPGHRVRPGHLHLTQVRPANAGSVRVIEFGSLGLR